MISKNCKVKLETDWKKKRCCARNLEIIDTYCTCDRLENHNGDHHAHGIDSWTDKNKRIFSKDCKSVWPRYKFIKKNTNIPLGECFSNALGIGVLIVAIALMLVGITLLIEPTVDVGNHSFLWLGGLFLLFSIAGFIGKFSERKTWWSEA